MRWCVCVCMFRRLNKFTWKIIQINEEITIIAAKAKSIWEHWSISRNHKLASKQVNEAFNVTEILRGDREKQATPLPIANWKWKRKRHTVMFIKSVLCFLRFIVYTYSSPPRGWLHHGDTVSVWERARERKWKMWVHFEWHSTSIHSSTPSISRFNRIYVSLREWARVSEPVSCRTKPNQTPNARKHHTDFAGECVYSAIRLWKLFQYRILVFLFSLYRGMHYICHCVAVCGVSHSAVCHTYTHTYTYIF